MDWYFCMASCKTTWSFAICTYFFENIAHFGHLQHNSRFHNKSRANHDFDNACVARCYLDILWRWKWYDTSATAPRTSILKLKHWIRHQRQEWWKLSWKLRLYYCSNQRAFSISRLLPKGDRICPEKIGENIFILKCSPTMVIEPYLHSIHWYFYLFMLILYHMPPDSSLDRTWV